MKKLTLNARLARFGIVLITGGLLVACRDNPPPPASREALPEGVAAVVAGRPIPESRWRARLARRGPGADPRAVLDQLIRTEAAFAKAQAEGFDQRPEMQAAVRRLVAGRYVEEQRSSLGQEPKVSARSVQDYYEAHREEFALPARVRGAVLLVAGTAKASAAKRAEARRRALTLLDRARAGEPFAGLAVRHSEHRATRYRGGETGWLTEGAGGGVWPEAVLEALFALKHTGEFAPLIEAEGGFYAVQLLERRPAAFQPLTEVDTVIRRRLMREAMGAREARLTAQITAGLKIQIDPALLSSLPAKASVGRPPALTGTQAVTSRAEPPNQPTFRPQ